MEKIFILDDFSVETTLVSVMDRRTERLFYRTELKQAGEVLEIRETMSEGQAAVNHWELANRLGESVLAK